MMAACGRQPHTGHRTGKSPSATPSWASCPMLRKHPCLGAPTNTHTLTHTRACTRTRTHTRCLPCSVRFSLVCNCLQKLSIFHFSLSTNPPSLLRQHQQHPRSRSGASAEPGLPGQVGRPCPCPRAGGECPPFLFPVPQPPRARGREGSEVL